MIKFILNQFRLSRLKRAIRIVEKAGLAAVNIKQSNDGALYIVAGSGTYVRFNKVKKPH